MAGWLALMLIVAVGGRETTRELNVFQIMEVRSILGFLMLYPLIRRAGGFAAMKTSRPLQHVARNLILRRAARLVLRADADPLGQVVSIEFTMPIWTAILAAAFSRRAHDGVEGGGDRARDRRRHRHRATSTGEINPRPVDRARRGGRIRHLHRHGQVADPHRKYARHHLLDAGGAVGGRISPVDLCLDLAVGLGLGWIVVIAFCGTFSHYCMARAMLHADATVVIPMDFLRVPLSAAAGWLIYSERLDMFTVLGASLILAGNLLNLKAPTAVAARAT
jgi:drug/metabolite transporter (DMT)-like permease